MGSDANPPPVGSRSRARADDRLGRRRALRHPHGRGRAGAVRRYATPTARSTSRRSTGWRDRSRSEAQSPVTRSASTSSRSRRAAGAGAACCPTSACCRTTSRTATSAPSRSTATGFASPTTSRSRRRRSSGRWATTRASRARTCLPAARGRRQHGQPAPAAGHGPLAAGARPRRPLLGRRPACVSGRRRGVGRRAGMPDARHLAVHPGEAHRPVPAVAVAGRADATHGSGWLPRHDGHRGRPDGRGAPGRACHDRLAWQREHGLDRRTPTCSAAWPGT